MPAIRRSNIFDFFDPFQGFGFPYFGGAISQCPGYREVPVFADARMDLKVTPEAGRFKAGISQCPGYSEVPVFADARMDLKVIPEAGRFKADLPAFKKGGGHRRVGGRSKREQEEKIETCYANVDQVKAPSRKR